MSRQIIDTTTDNGTYKGDPAKVAFEKVNENFAELYKGFITHISGLQMTYVAPGSLRLSSGRAFIPGPASIVELAAPITKTGLTFTPNTWNHVYVLQAGGVGDFEVVAVEPDSPYMGMARSKLGDTSRRYVGSVRTDAAGAIKPFTHCVETGEILYSNNIEFIVSNGLASASTVVDCSTNVPATSTAAKCLMGNGNPTVNCFYGAVNAGPVTNGNYIGPIPPNNNLSPDVPLSAAQQFLYKYETPPSGTGLFVRIFGYKFER
ncbi:hypothetical protein ACTUVK_000556 [Stenotrophomonas rhizophila]